MLVELMDHLGVPIPETMQGFEQLHKASISEGVLTSKTKELIAFCCLWL